MEISLERSSSGIPYIEMGDMGRLIFSRTLKSDRGYKWFCYVRKYIDTVIIKNTVGKRQPVKFAEQFSLMYTMRLYRDEENVWGVKKGTIPPKIQKFFRKTFVELGIEHNNILYFPEDKIGDLKEIIDRTDFVKIVEEIPVKKKTTKKRGRPKNKSLQP